MKCKLDPDDLALFRNKVEAGQSRRDGRKRWRGLRSFLGQLSPSGLQLVCHFICRVIFGRPERTKPPRSHAIGSVLHSINPSNVVAPPSYSLTAAAGRVDCQKETAHSCPLPKEPCR
jgi:hypothetical protein